ncbi:MAG: Do family serine endopeptidase [Hyphomicrobiales bacterium]|nr:MAG: Do family serine endopeptidase [Hyphomicrobiales bacterium]
MRFGWAQALVVGVMLVASPVARAEGPASVSKLAAQLSPAVVNIGTTRMLGGGGMPFPEAPEGSPLNEMFDELNPNEGQGPEAMREARSLGSGFIIAADGTIVTNNHVVEGADEILVFLTDGTRLTAKLVGADPKADLAVLKVEAGRDLPFVEMGDSDVAQVGDWVMAIGNPFGLGGSVTLGIVSARNRDINAGPYDDFIQTDAAINQGNSGGPLFDMDGKVVGINTAIIARGGSGLGIGFAVPVNLARPVVMQLAEFGETRRGWLGVGIQDVTQEIADSLGRPNTHGAMVVDVTRTGPAEGVVEEGDIILGFNGRDIIRMRDLPRYVAETAVGEKVTVTVLRQGAEVTLDITLGRLEVGEQIVAAAQTPEVVPPAAEDAPAGPVALKEMLGLDVGPIDDAAREAFQIAETQTGVVITEVTEGTDASRQGLLSGLVISEVNQQKVTSVAELTEKVDAAKEAGRPAVLFKVTDPAGTSRFVAIKLIQ